MNQELLEVRNSPQNQSPDWLPILVNRSCLSTGLLWLRRTLLIAQHKLSKVTKRRKQMGNATHIAGNIQSKPRTDTSGAGVRADDIHEKMAAGQGDLNKDIKGTEELRSGQQHEKSAQQREEMPTKAGRVEPNFENNIQNPFNPVTDIRPGDNADLGREKPADLVQTHQKADTSEESRQDVRHREHKVSEST